MITPLVILLLWEFLSRQGYVRQSILPAPSRIYRTLVSMLGSGELMGHISISLIRVAKGFIIGSVLAIGLGFLCGLYGWIDDYLSLLVGLLRPIPILAWTPVLILWMGIDEGSKVALIAIGAFWSVLLNVVAGIRAIDPKLLEVARVFEKDRLELLTKLIIPSTSPYIFTGLRAGIDMAWRSVVGAEMIAASKGVGFLINYARDLSQPDVMFVGILSIGLVGVGIEKTVKLAEGWLLKWYIEE